MVWPETRPIAYDPELFWDEDAGTWTGVDAGGSRYKMQVVVVGQNDIGEGVIYFGAI
jgi:hypothetical protein